ncbi:uncharacterized protein ColSpa_04517 [Colletotrichum spaethianum]|uniref:Uncharacterized protein n=1 Tax=Colletotrichum spaethianum TaxID=700344 RepID=A0AA37L933_9PEZI|nr:uncharacterized protein ColSpa_04517 [Colletotrichum spaethianum]GKT44336.1 hypothetical protein ColSpa_04517 [Colletotrichum spaethianum]
MPVTELSQHPLTNLGPLTTVFTAPSACATRSPDLYLAFESAFTDRVQPFFPKRCEYNPLSNCFPSGSALDASYTSASSLGFPGGQAIAYFSPASICPEAYTTAGVAAKNSNGEVSSAGVFSPPVVEVPIGSQPEGRGPLAGIIGSNPILNVLTEALDNGEIAVICCPRDYIVGYQGGCFSEVPESVYGEKEMCQRQVGREHYTWANATITYNDTVVTGSVFSYTATSNAVSTQITTFTDDDSGPFQLVASRPAVTLIFNTVEATVTGAGGSDGGSGTAAPTETSPSAAYGWGMTSSGRGVGLLTTVWALAAFAGAALAVPF